MSIPVWSYWEGRRWPHIDICIGSLKRTCEGFRLLTPENIWNYIGRCDFHENFYKITEPAHRADCFRAAVLARHGGFWFDCDTIGLKDPSHLVDASMDCLYCTWSNPPQWSLNGYIYMRAGSKIVREWLKNINSALAKIEIGRDISWTLLGEKSLSPAIHSDLKKAKKIQRDHFLPIDIDNNVRQFFDRSSSWQEFVSDRTVCFGLNNSWMMRNKRMEMLLCKRKQASSPLLIHRLLTYAMEKNYEQMDRIVSRNPGPRRISVALQLEKT